MSAYCRLLQEDERAKESLSIENQKDMFLRYAREHHFPNPTFFVDDGVSGVTYDRPGFQSMLAEIEAGRVSVCISKDLSRLGRNSALTVNVPYGYLKDPENPTRWKIDPVAADVVKHIFSLCMEGRGPKQIANQLKADKVLTPTAYKTLQGIKSPNKKPENPYDWHSSTVVAIFERREYTGCTVNFKTFTNSIWDKKQRETPVEKRAIFPNAHERIIDDDVFEKVQEIRQQRH